MFCVWVEYPPGILSVGGFNLLALKIALPFFWGGGGPPSCPLPWRRPCSHSPFL